MVLRRLIGILNDSSGISDPRMNRFLMKTPLEPITAITLYLVFIYKIGPKFMESRKPFDLRNTIIGYNAIQIAANASIFVMALLILPEMSLKCTPPAPNTPDASFGLTIHYSYALLKYFDFVETIFFVLRKKRRQISFLHVYHHIGMLVAAWISAKYFPGGQALFVGLYNSFVHLVMYCYYLITAWRPNYTQNVWWKKYVTLVQIVQHYMVFLSTSVVVLNTECTYPKGLMALFASNCLVIIYLFTKFYKENYLTIKDEKKA